MLIRIVKMSFQLDKLPTFLQHFEHHRQQIRHFEGCQYLQILQDAQNPNVLFSYSYWASAEHLEAYRHSEFFQSVWQYTKTLFDAPPQAWTTRQLDLLL